MTKATTKRQQYPFKPRLPPDSYGYYRNEHGDRAKRHPDCVCDVPCQLRFTCEHPEHFGRRSTPYCQGNSEDNWCTNCWNKEYEKKKKKNDDQH